MKLWIDDIRPAPGDMFHEWAWCRSVDTAKQFIEAYEQRKEELLDEWDFPPQEIWDMTIEVIDIDHDAGDYVNQGGDYIKLLDWLEVTGRNYPIRIHSMNPVDVANMRAIIERNGWEEVK